MISARVLICALASQSAALQLQFADRVNQSDVSKRTCVDALGYDGKTWDDGYGALYNCEWFAADSDAVCNGDCCAKYGDNAPRAPQTLTANQACCACGKRDVTPEPPCDTSTGTCTVVEDPHIVVFDGTQVSLAALKGVRATAKMNSGDEWLVKSANVSIQARYMPDEMLEDKNEFVRAVAVGGAFLQGNIITVGSLEDPITWNGKPILESQNGSSGFDFHDDEFSVQVKRSDHSLNVADMKTESPGISIKLPLGVSLIVNRLRHHLNVAITMPQQEHGQDGLCGNFNGLAADDSLEMASKRFHPSVPREESLFTGLTFS